MEVTEYRRRRPEESVLYRVVQENLETFLELAAHRSGGKGLPTYVRQEFERYLDCGILANGFARVRCGACGHDSVVGFSCKGRGFCPSCMGRRMADTAAHLVDRVLPHVPIRQWVISFPWPVRFQLARDSKLLTRALEIFIEEVFRYYKRELIYAREELDPDEWRHRRSLPYQAEMVGGAVTSVQRYGSSLHCHVHGHSLVLDGVYWRDPETQRVHFFQAPKPTPEALQEVVHRVAKRVNGMLERKGVLVLRPKEEGGGTGVEPAEPSVLDVMQGASIQGVVGLGEKWKRVQVVGRVKGLAWMPPEEKPDTAAEEGYSIHAGVELDGRDREGLEEVCRYLFRPAFAEERLTRLPDGRLEYDFRKARPDGGRRTVLEPIELMERLAAMVPPPRSHLVRYHGVLGPSHYWREVVVPRPPAEEGCPVDRDFDPADEEDGRPGRRRRRKGDRTSLRWAERILRSLKLDVLSCPNCGGRMRVISTITEPWTVRRILRSMGLSAEIPPRAPPRGSPQGEFGFDQ